MNDQLTVVLTVGTIRRLGEDVGEMSEVEFVRKGETWYGRVYGLSDHGDACLITTPDDVEGILFGECDRYALRVWGKGDIPLDWCPGESIGFEVSDQVISYVVNGVVDEGWSDGEGGRCRRR